MTEEQIKDFEHSIPVELAIGHASFHHPLLMHGSYENKSERSRRATLINVFADGVVSNRDLTNIPGTDNYPQVPKGETMGGTYYPLLMDQETEISQLRDIPTINTV